jgi:competence protein ComEC
MNGAADSASPESETSASGESSPKASERAPYQPLVIVFAAATVGMAFDRYAVTPLSKASIGSGQFASWSLASFACAAVWWHTWRRERNRCSCFALLMSVACLAGAWHHLNWDLFGATDASRFATYQPAPACITAIACESPERVSAAPPTPLRAIPGTERSRLLVEVTAIRDGRQWHAASGLCQLSVNGHMLGVQPGDTLRVYGQLSRPSPPLNPGEFDFAADSRADRELSRMRSSAPECAVRVATGSAWSPTYLLDRVRVAAKQYVRSTIGPRRAGLAAAILLGAREGLPYEATEPYLETGTIHVLVVSGMNVAILAFGLLLFMKMGWLPRHIGLGVIVVIVVSYALLAESQPPVMRAAVLGVLMCVSIWTGRRGIALNSLFAAALFVLVLNPNDLFRVGPQLSFLAVAALIWCSSWPGFKIGKLTDPLDHLLESSRPWYFRAILWGKNWAMALLMTSLAVWLVTLPLVLGTFHIVSLIAIPSSLLVWPLVTLAMWSGFFMVVAGWMWSPFGNVCGGVCDWSLGKLELLVNAADNVPGGHFWAPGPAWWWVAVFYIAVIWLMAWGRTVVAVRWQLAALAVWILVGLVPPTTRAFMRDGLDCSFVAVGHGACVVMHTPDGKTMLYDAGAIGSPEYATQSIASYLWHRGIMRVDGIVISHADIDHYNAIPGLLERFRVGAVYVSPVMFEDIGTESAAGGVKVLHAAIERAGVPIREIWAGDNLQIGAGVTARVFHPPRVGVLGSDNANSITMGVEYASRRLLLPGDLESPGIDDLMAEVPYDCDILMAPHHGSRRSDPPGFAAWSRPEWVVISGGGSDDIQPVVKTYEQHRARVEVTNDSGTIEFHLTKTGEIESNTWRGAEMFDPSKGG